MNKHDFAYNLRRIIELAERSTQTIGHEGDDCNIIKVIAQDMLRHCDDDIFVTQEREAGTIAVTE
jgi:hypothetical protein